MTALQIFLLPSIQKEVDVEKKLLNTVAVGVENFTGQPRRRQATGQSRWEADFFPAVACLAGKPNRVKFGHLKVSSAAWPAGLNYN